MRYRRSGALALAAMMLLGAGSAWTVLGDHATSGVGNHCATCHNNQASAALRGWGSSLAGVPLTGWYTRTITKLCWSCHQAGSPSGANNVTLTAMANEQTSGVHMYTPGSVYTVDGSAQENYAATGLPYTRTNGPIECTTCHNVHNDDGAPFLNRPNMGGTNGICVTCHERANEDPSAVAGNNQYGTGNRSLHPTNAPYSDNGSNGVTTFESPMDARLRVPLAGLSGARWTLGGHLTTAQEGTAGNISCQTCHAVHGTDALTGVEDLLAIPNNYNTAGQPSALCEGCHGGPAGAAVNHVGTGTDHPIDSDAGRPFYPVGTTMPTAWTNTTDQDTPASPFWGGTAPASNAPTCSGCHDTHGGISATSLLRSPSASADGWCFECHAASAIIPAFHHSNIHNDQDGGDFSALDCGDCHGSSGTGYWRAHNGFWDFRAAPDEINPTGTVYQSLCEACHNPLNPTELYAGYASPMPASHGNATGTDSHVVSDYGNSLFIADDDSTFNSFLRWTPTWPQTNAQRSKVGNYAGGATNGAYIICESCHNIVNNCAITVAAGDPDGGGWKTNLLLEAYEDDDPGSIAGAENPNNVAGQTGDTLCRRCHYTGTADAPAEGTYVHYPAAHTTAGFTYTLADAPYGRATLTILTNGAAACPERSTSDAAGAPGVMSFPAANVVNCDSCHRPHNADADGPTGGFGHVILEDGSTAGIPKTDACDQCHDTQVQCQ